MRETVEHKRIYEQLWNAYCDYYVRNEDGLDYTFYDNVVIFFYRR